MRPLSRADCATGKPRDARAGPVRPYNRRMRTAVIGVGYLGRFHAQKYAALEGSELVAAVDVAAENRERIAAELRVPALADYRELLGRVDAVSIATPTPFHFEI